MIARAAIAFGPDQAARLGNIDFLVDQLDDEMDTLLAECGIADPMDEGDMAGMGEPMMNARRSKLRSAISRAHRSGDARLPELQAAYRALPLAHRRAIVRAAVLPGAASPERTYRAIGAISREDIAPPTDVAPDGTLYGHFAVFNTDTEVDSMWEGRFIERIAPGAFSATIKADISRMRVTLNHGGDPTMGDRPMAEVNVLREDKIGAYYEAALVRGVPEMVMDGLRRGLYGASFRFYVMREIWSEKPTPSSTNPTGLPERTITEAQVEEFGPVTFPQYPQASARLRSKTAPAPAQAGIVKTPEKAKENTAWLLSRPH